MMHCKLLLCVLFMTFMLSSCTSSQQPSVQGPSPTPSAAVSLQNCAVATATNFYQAIKEHNTSKAYGYLDSIATTSSGHKLTYDAFMQQVKASGTSGRAFTFSVAGFVPSSDQVVMTIDNGQMRYHSHLHVNRAGNTCKITSFDRV